MKNPFTYWYILSDVSDVITVTINISSRNAGHSCQDWNNPVAGFVIYTVLFWLMLPSQTKALQLYQLQRYGKSHEI